MILGTLQCNVYGKTITKWSEEMRMTKESKGRPKWYDFGKAYDNITITAVITSEEGATFEALIRNQNLEESIQVEWESGEWLFGYTGGFTIQDFEYIERVDKDLSEWGYKITFGSDEPIDMSTLAGDRTQCDGAGYITYSTTKIPQPKKFDFQYQTKKFTGLTHGSSYSAEMPTNNYDKTSFPVVINSGNMRNLIDDIIAHRGMQFFVTFPDGCYPFGISQGNGQFTCVQSKREFTITNENGDWWSIDIGLYNYIPILIPLDPWKAEITRLDDVVVYVPLDGNDTTITQANVIAITTQASIKSVKIGEGIESVGSDAFNNTGSTTPSQLGGGVTLPSTLTFISANAFRSWYYGTVCEFHPDSQVAMYNATASDAFTGFGLDGGDMTALTAELSVTNAANSAFRHFKFGHVNFNQTVTALETRSFEQGGVLQTMTFAQVGPPAIDPLAYNGNASTWKLYAPNDLGNELAWKNAWDVITSGNKPTYINDIPWGSIA